MSVFFQEEEQTHLKAYIVVKLYIFKDGEIRKWFLSKILVHPPSWSPPKSPTMTWTLDVLIISLLCKSYKIHVLLGYYDPLWSRESVKKWDIWWLDVGAGKYWLDDPSGSISPLRILSTYSYISLLSNFSISILGSQSW